MNTWDQYHGLQCMGRNSISSWDWRNNYEHKKIKFNSQLNAVFVNLAHIFSNFKIQLTSAEYWGLKYFLDLLAVIIKTAGNKIMLLKIIVGKKKAYYVWQYIRKTILNWSIQDWVRICDPGTDNKPFIAPTYYWLYLFDLPGYLCLHRAVIIYILSRI